MTDATEMPKYDGMEYEELVAAAQFMWMENAKLRELVQGMMTFFENGDYCTTCGLVTKCDAQEQYEGDCLMRDEFQKRMQELGVLDE